MGKITGFMEYTRAEAGHRPVKERVCDWNEFVQPQNEEALRLQAARCMDCGVPFCHAGFVVQGLSIGCPLCNLVPEINDLVYKGEIEAAYERLSKTHPFPEITGRVCPALCEGSCTLGEHELPVTIKEIERYVADTVLQNGNRQPRIPQQRTGKRVAVVGSGPAGLACADMLNQLGDEVTVFERADRPGGLLMYGIPNMKLDKQLVLNRAAMLETEGVRFVLNADIGGDTPALKLVKEYDAVVLCAGAMQQRLLAVPGSKLEGVVTALDYLTRATRAVLGDDTADGRVPSAKGKDVIVVGGGDTGTDCVATAIRQGAKSVKQFEIMPQLPQQRAANNPWPLWPKVRKTDYGQREAEELLGADPREYETTVKEIVDDGKGAVAKVITVQVEWQNQDGRMVPVEVKGSEQVHPAGLVLTAMGFTGPEKQLIDELGLATTPRGSVQTGDEEYASSLATVFTAGDMRRGPSLVVWAIQEGRRAAEQCHAYLQQR